jgi:hypothetical protein
MCSLKVVSLFIVAVGDRVTPAPRADLGVRLSCTGLLPKVERDRGSGLWRPCPPNPQSRSFGYTPYPALSPGRASVPAFPPADRLPSTISATDLRSALLEASQVIWNHPAAYLSRDGLLGFPSRPSPALAVLGEMMFPRFRRVPLRLSPAGPRQLCLTAADQCGGRREPVRGDYRFSTSTIVLPSAAGLAAT